MIRHPDILILIVLLVIPWYGANGQGQISLDHVDGLTNEGTLKINQPIVFYIRFTNLTGSSITGSTNGFKVYSPDGAVWEPIVFDTTGAINISMYDGGVFLNYFSITGSGADTVGFAGFKMFGIGIPHWFDAIVGKIKTSLNSSQSGRTLCLDTTFYPPGGVWLWSSDPDVKPEWEGPHCYAISNSSPVEQTDGNDRYRFKLMPNFPNPFNPETRIGFTLPYKTEYTLTIHNLLGQKVRRFNGVHSAGPVEIIWNAGDLAGGIYFYRLTADKFSDIRKMVLIK